jgi:hypothetical protein
MELTMLNGNDWHATHGEFLDESQRLLHTCQECVAHLELISGDEDAVRCLLGTLRKLSENADTAHIPCTAEFTRALRNVIAQACLTTEALQTLEHCLTLLAWQIELIDLRTGQLPLDDSEQLELLDRFATTCGLERLIVGNFRQPHAAQLQPQDANEGN